MKIIDKIDAFLDGQLKEDELKKFTEEMKQDEKLAAEVFLHKEINESITDDEVYHLRQKLSLIIAKSSRKFPLVKTISAIAAGAIVIFSVINISNDANPTKTFSKFYTPYQSDLSTRSADNTVSGLNFAFKLYAEAEYETAFEILNNYNQESFNNTAAHYYQGLCAIELNKNDVAIKSFQTVINEGDYAYSLHAKWYLGMTYLKTEQPTKAIIYLEELSGSQNFYTARAHKILKKYF